VRILPILALSGVLIGAAAWFLLPGRIESPRTETEGAAPPVIEAPRTSVQPPPTTGRLVVRVRTADGSPVPETTTAGYLQDGVRRMRKAAPNGTFPFSDAPVGSLQATADAPGYVAEKVPVQVIGNVDAAEPIVTLTPVK
jgi:hypothetical protein